MRNNLLLKRALKKDRYNKLLRPLRFRFSTILIICILSTNCATNQKNKINDTIIDKMVSKIDVNIDSNFVYEYEKTKFVPPKDKTLLIMGQTVEGINEYNYSFPNEMKPAGWSAYWAITEFVGVTEKHTNITGSSQNHQMLVDNYPNAVLHSAMWMVGKWDVVQSTIKGTYDSVIKKYCDWVKTINRPVYLRLGYEFDGPHNLLEPAEYIEAYKHIVDIMRAEGVTNVAYVWHSYASVPYQNHPVSSWYPGDDYVDWVAISVFFQPYDDIFNHKETNTVLNFAKQKEKPVMIAEANPVLGIKANDNKIWDKWFTNFFSFCYNKNIKAIAFINEDWTRLNIEGLPEWKDARLYNNEKISKAWFMETNKDRYLKQSPKLFELLGYK